jgi:hypothetical protein
MYFLNSPTLIPTSSARDFSGHLIVSRVVSLHKRYAHSELDQQLDEDYVWRVVESIGDLIYQIMALGLYLVARLYR